MRPYALEILKFLSEHGTATAAQAAKDQGISGTQAQRALWALWELEYVSVAPGCQVGSILYTITESGVTRLNTVTTVQKKMSAVKEVQHIKKPVAKGVLTSWIGSNPFGVQV